MAVGRMRVDAAAISGNRDGGLARESAVSSLYDHPRLSRENAARLPEQMVFLADVPPEEPGT